MLPRAIFILLALCSAGLADRQAKVINSCSYTIWPGLFTSIPSPVRINHVTGWELAPGASSDLILPNNWQGRLWPRTDCDFSKGTGPDTCVTGGCLGGLECAIDGGTSSGAVTLAEFAMSQWGNLDFYDISAVDGINVPMSIRTNIGEVDGQCQESSCNGDVLSICPDELAVRNSAGKTVGCKTDCTANPNNEQFCCLGAFNSHDVCTPSVIPHYNLFKEQCRNGYVYPMDDQNNSLFSCSGDKNPSYIIEFCSSNGGNFKAEYAPNTKFDSLVAEMGDNSTESTASSTPTGSTLSSTYIGLIVGGVILLIIIACIVAYVIIQRNKRENESNKEEDREKMIGPSDSASESGSESDGVLKGVRPAAFSGAVAGAVAAQGSHQEAHEMGRSRRSRQSRRSGSRKNRSYSRDRDSVDALDSDSDSEADYQTRRYSRSNRSNKSRSSGRR